MKPSLRIPVTLGLALVGAACRQTRPPQQPLATAPVQASAPAGPPRDPKARATYNQLRPRFRRDEDPSGSWALRHRAIPRPWEDKTPLELRGWIEDNLLSCDMTALQVGPGGPAILVLRVGKDRVLIQGDAHLRPKTGPMGKVLKLTAQQASDALRFIAKHAEDQVWVELRGALSGAYLLDPKRQAALVDTVRLLDALEGIAAAQDGLQDEAPYQAAAEPTGPR